MINDIVAALRNWNDYREVPSLIEEAADKIERLRKERDEARRDVCNMMHITGFLAGDYAASRGWNCFPDMKRNVSDEVKNFRTIIERDYNAVVAQRDEARRECCLTWEAVMGRDSRDVAADKGWDCFKENTNDQ